MTAEIAVLNRAGVALAADSAVTMNGNKIYPSAEKLFMLSRQPAVGVMIYQNAEFMGLPWEMLVREARSACGKYDSLEAYAQFFLDFLQDSRELFPADAEALQVRTLALSAIRRSVDDLLTSVVSETLFDGKSTRAAKMLMTRRLGERLDELRNRPLQSNMVTAARIEKDFDDALEDVVDIAVSEITAPFQDLVTSTGKERLLHIAAESIVRSEVDGRTKSGVVMAGYGSHDFLPKLRSFELEGIYCENLKYVAREEYDISRQESAAVVPFAQRDVVETFLFGMDPACMDFVGHFWLSWLSEQYPQIVSDTMRQIGVQNTRATAVESALRTVAPKVIENFAAQMEHWSRNNVWGPIVATVSGLPKSELGEMAEALVNLTSFKRHVSDELETVGGPIDVAVLTRSDGFVWINRKHYFESDRNPAFMANYAEEP